MVTEVLFINSVTLLTTMGRTSARCLDHRTQEQDTVSALTAPGRGRQAHGEVVRPCGVKGHEAMGFTALESPGSCDS